MKIVKRIAVGLGVFILFLAVLSLFVFTTVDRTPYKDMAYYKRTMSELKKATATQLSMEGDTLKVGWAKEGLLPDKPLPLAGYGVRHGALHEGIHDSLWVRSFVFDNGIQKIAYVSLDLLIVPMEVTQLLPQALDSLGFSMNTVFLTATHSHCSIGAWGTGMAGQLFAGEYDPDVVRFITKAIATSISNAKRKTSPARIGYAEIEAGNLVTNRLVGDQEGTIDPWIRVVKINQNSGKTAILSSYSAHATCLHHSFRQVSGDYPGELCRNLEKLPGVDFAAFSAGAMGSMTSLTHNISGWPKVEYFAGQLTNQIHSTQNFMPTSFESTLGSFHANIYLREAHFRVSENIRVRPWVFERLFGGYPTQITSFRVGNILFVGTPCDFSGELVAPLSKQARDAGLELIVTSFNGGYAGYITKDEWYDRDSYETRVMNWFGPYNGAYFTEVILKMIEYHSQSTKP